MPKRKYVPGPVEGTSLSLRAYDEDDTNYGLFDCACGGERRARLRYVYVGYPAKRQKHDRTTNCGDRAKHPDKRSLLAKTGRDDVRYKTAHDRLTSRYGNLPCSLCGAPEAEWSYLWTSDAPKVQPEGLKDAGLVYSVDGTDYSPMCRTECHPRWERACKQVREGLPKGSPSLVHVALKEVGYLDHLTEMEVA